MLKKICGKLNELTLYVRYCFIEEPYWHAFISHYYNLGVRNINVIIQTRKDEKSFQSFYYPNDLNFNIHRVSNKTQVDHTWFEVSFKNKEKPTKYAILVDADEFLYFLNPNISLDELMNTDIKKIPWLMNPLSSIKSEKAGFFGNMYKEIANYEKIKNIKNCHQFKLKNNFDFINLKVKNKNIIGQNHNFNYTYNNGVVLIHTWARSLNDCLIRGIFSRIKKNKNKDYKEIIENIKSGKLTVRSRYLAYLDIQNKYIKNLKTDFRDNFNYEKEMGFLNNFFTKKELLIFQENFKIFKSNLKENISILPKYPPTHNSIVKQIKELESFQYYSYK